MSRPAKIWIGVGAGVLLLIYVFGMLLWLSNQPPVLSRSKEKDPLSGYPLKVRLNPVRDRSPERSAEKVLHAMSDGKCRQQLAGWFKTTAGTTPSSSATPSSNIQLFRGVCSTVKNSHHW